MRQQQPVRHWQVLAAAGAGGNLRARLVDTAGTNAKKTAFVDIKLAADSKPRWVDIDTGTDLGAAAPPAAAPAFEFECAGDCTLFALRGYSAFS